jgi:hypothetical protein
VKVPQAALLHALKEAGWVDCGRLASHDFPSKKHIFASPEIYETAKKSDIRRMVEENPPPKMVLVK